MCLLSCRATAFVTALIARAAECTELAFNMTFADAKVSGRDFSDRIARETV
jgi:hypothetical protein